MNIIFGKEKLEGIDSKYTVLELDTINVNSRLETAYCLIESVPITEMASIEQSRTLHENFIRNYKLKNWKYCEDALEHLIGKWNKELDTFYLEMARRISDHKEHGVPDDWTGNIDYNLPKQAT